MAELNNSGAGQWSETDGSNTSASPNGWPAGTFPNQVEGIGQATMGAIKRFWDRINGTVTTTGSANAYVYTPVNASFPTAYVAGEIYTAKANFTNMTASTININGLGGKNIFAQTPNGPAALVGGEIQSGQMFSCLYDGTQMQLLGASSVLRGTNTNNDAAVGVVGEIVESNIGSGSAVSLTTNTNTDITSISLTAGDWDVWGGIATSPQAGTTQSNIAAWVNTSSVTNPGAPNGGAFTQLVASFTISQPQVLPVGMKRIKLAITTTIYLSCRVGFMAGTNSAYGYISARRAR